MSTILLSTAKALFARSGNRCAFPQCSELLVRDDGVVIGEICHIKASNPGGPRYELEQTRLERNSYDNLILLCANHHKVVDRQPGIYTPEYLTELKRQVELRFGRDEDAKDSAMVAALLAAQPTSLRVAERSNVVFNSPGAIQNSNVVFKTARKSPLLTPPSGTIGADADAVAYVKYLIDRYNEFAKSEPSRSKAFSHGAIYATIKSRFGCHWNLVPLGRFEEVCSYLNGRILRTRVAKSASAKGRSVVSSFVEYVGKYRR